MKKEYVLNKSEIKSKPKVNDIRQDYILIKVRGS